MSNRNPAPFKTPVGRLVWGSVHKARAIKDDRTGQAKLIKTGEHAGQPLTMYQFGIAVPKTMAQWQAEPGWGQTIYAEGMACWPGGQTQRPDFSWKVTDGDSQVPNKNNKKPCDQAGYPGHWILSFSSMGAPVIVTTVGTPGGQPQTSLVDNLINAGDYVEVGGSVTGNDSAQTAGVYLNHTAVCLRGYGERIAQGPDIESFGFGGGALPVGATMQPQGQALPPAVAPPPAAAYVPPTQQAAPPVPQVPVVPVVPTIPTPPPAGPVLTGKDGQTTPAHYTAMIAAGWTDATLRANGYIV